MDTDASLPRLVERVADTVGNAVRKEILAYFARIGPAAARGVATCADRESGFLRNVSEEAVPAAIGILERFRAMPGHPEQEIPERYRGTGYGPGYLPTGFAEQVRILRRNFPELSRTGQPGPRECHGQALPPGAEDWFAIPRWSKLGNTYRAALERVLVLLGLGPAAVGLDPLDLARLRESPDKARAMEAMAKEQGSDILRVPAQFGSRHCGRSILRARAAMDGSEFGLGAYEAGIMLLTQPGRLQHEEDLGIDCPGDGYSPDADGSFGYGPSFRFDRDVGLVFGTQWQGTVYAGCGSASAFRAPAHS